MASNITIEKDLEAFVPVWNRMEVTIKQNDAPTLALTDYKHIIDVYIEGVSGYKRYEILPDPAYSMGSADVSRYVQGNCYSTLSQNTSFVPFALGANANGTQSILKVTLKYGYSYMNSGVYTVVADSVVGSAKYAWHCSLDWHEWLDFDYTDYICNITNGANGQWLTDMKTHYVGINDLGWFHILTDTPTDVDYLVVKTYSDNNFTTLIQTATKAISVTQSATSSRMYNVATCPESLNNMTGAFVTGAQPIVTASVLSYTVQLTNSASVVASEILYFVIEEECRYERRRLHFLNKYGSFDAFNFDLKSTERREIERKTYKMDAYPMRSTGISRSHSDRAQLVNYTSTQDFIGLKSDFISEAENDWLKQLIESPEIYLEFTDGTGAKNFKPVESIVGTSWLEKQTKNDKLFNMEVEIKMSHKNIRQGR